MTEYDRFTREEFEEELPEGFKEVKISAAKEVVYDKELDDGLAVRVYSTVWTTTSVSRRSGSDAIRISLRHKPSGETIRRSGRTLRIKDADGRKKWPENMREKIQKQEKYGKNPARCPFCGGLMKRIEGKNQFYGCTNYPDCRYSAKIGEDGRPVSKTVTKRGKKAYRFLMRKHDPKRCEVCNRDAELAENFYDGLFHYLLENGRLSDKQYRRIEPQVNQG